MEESPERKLAGQVNNVFARDVGSTAPVRTGCFQGSLAGGL